MKVKRHLLLLAAAFCLQTGAFAQSINMKNVTVRQALTQIEKECGYSFVYEAKDLNTSQKVTIKADDCKEAIKQVLAGQHVTYVINGKNVVISKVKSGNQQPKGKRRKVSGKVLDKNGEPIIGATVRVKDSNEGTITDVDGNFNIDVDSESALQISYIGFQEQVVSVGDRSQLMVTLGEDNKLLDEVVVIGYGTQRKGDITSSVGSVKREDFISGAVNDAGRLIQGKIAGLSVTRPNGNPTSGTEISLRGNTTILGASTNPLILVDGVPGDFNTVAPEDIESIDVLKDGSAAAIYGSRGTNGVVLITTRKSKGNDINEVQYSTYLSLSTIAKRPDFCTASDYRQQIEDGLRDAAWDLGYDTDWIDAITRVGVSHVHNVSFKGGNAQTNYIFNINYRDLQGIMKRSDKQEFQGRAEVNHSMFDNKLRFNFQLLGNQTGYTATSDGSSFNNYTWRQALIHNPTESIKNEDGTWTENTGIFNYENPMARLYECDGEQSITQTRFSANITFNPIKELTVNALLSYDKSNQEGGYYETKNHISNVRDGQNGYASTGSSAQITKLAEITAQFNKTWGSHTFQALVGYSYQGNTYRQQYERNYDFPTDNYSWHNIGQGQALKEGLGTMYSYQLDSNLIGFFGRINYNYKNRYMLMASVRHEAASQLAGADEPWGTFPSISLGWRVTEEPFMEDQRIFDDLKVRAGYGVTGSQPSNSFLGVSLLGYGDYYLYNGEWIRSLQPTQNSNNTLKWEEKHEYDLGIDFSVLNSRINVSIDWYYRLIKGLLYDYTVPSPPNVYTTTRANVGEMSNNGLEVMINAIPIQTRDFKWNSTVTFSTNTNKLKSLSNDLYQASTDYFMTGWITEPVKTESHIVRIGHQVGDIYGFKVVDVDDEGKWIYEDKDGNLVGYDNFSRTFEDKKVLGNGVPKWYLGFNNQFSYKKWDLAINMRGAFGFQIINQTRMFYENRSRQDWNRLRSAYDKVFGKAVLNSLCSEEFNSYYVEDGDYWKIDNITLGYTFGKIGKYIQSLRLYGSVNNALTITGYKGIDPEVSTSGLSPSNDTMQNYPHARDFTFGLNVTF